jgi:hypothetical protein
MRLNFKRFTLFQGIDKKNALLTDVSKAIADGLYNTMQGITSHALALKIYNATGEEEYSDEEIEMLRNFSKQCTPAFMDSFEEFVKLKETTDTNG